MSDHNGKELDWLQRVRRGDFVALPAPFTWSQTSEFSHLLHGYRVSESLGLGPLRIWANQRINEARRAGRWRGTATELWLCTFYEHRRYRHMGEGDPAGPDLDLLNQLCSELRARLQIVSDTERTSIVRFIMASAAAVSGETHLG